MNSFWSLEDVEGGERLRLYTSRRVTMDRSRYTNWRNIHVFQVLYMCNGSQGLNKRNKHRMWKTCRYSSRGETRQNTYMWGKSHSNINVNGKTNQETTQPVTPHIPDRAHPSCDRQPSAVATPPLFPNCACCFGSVYL